MKNCWLKILTTFLLGLILMGCQKEVVRKETVYQWEKSPETPKSEMGGIDSGGGNGVEGRPLESFRVNMLQDKQVHDELLPIISSLHEIHNRFAADFLHILKHRMWYFVPVKLEKLSPLKVGVAFKDEDLGQIGLQDTQEVWIDSKIYSDMNSNDKIKILVHELVMGVRILEFTREFDKCLAAASAYLFDEDESIYKKARDECYEKFQWLGTGTNLGVIGGDKIELNDHDYKAVRTMTNWIVDDFESLSETQIDSFLKGALKRNYD